MTQYFEDFGTYSTGDIASVTSGAWAKLKTGTNWAQEIAAATGSDDDKVLKHYRPTTGSQYWIVSTWDTPGAHTTDVEIVARCVAGGAWSEGVHRIGPCLVDSTSAGYMITRSDVNTVALLRFSSTGAAAQWLGSPITFTDLSANDAFWVKVGRTGSTIYGAIWLDGESDPGTQASGTHSPAGGAWEVKAGFATLQYFADPFQLDQIGLGTDGDAAPTSEPVPDSTVAPLACLQSMWRSAQ